MNTAPEYSTRVVQEGGRRCKKSTLNDLVHLTPLRIPLMNPPSVFKIENVSEERRKLNLQMNKIIINELFRICCTENTDGIMNAVVRR